MNFARGMVHYQEADFSFLGFVLREAKADDFDLLEEWVIPVGASGGYDRRILNGPGGVTGACGRLFLKILHDIVSAIDEAAKDHRE